MSGQQVQTQPDSKEVRDPWTEDRVVVVMVTLQPPQNKGF